MSRKQIADYLATGYWESTGEKPRKFDVMAGGTLTANITALTPEGQELAKGAMAVWSRVSGINFELSTSPDAHIIFDDEDPGAFSNSIVTDNGTIITQSFVNVSTEWLYGYGSLFDSYTYSTYIHEVGHALGLGHPGPYNGQFPDLSSETISPYDSWQVSVMSYIPQTVSLLDLTPGNVETSYAHPVTPMIADVEAIHQLYGEPEGINSGNTIYGRGANMGGPEEKFYKAWSGEGEGNPFFNVNFTGQTAPTFYDYDGDGDLDMSTLSLDRTVVYDYKNVGTATNPKYEPYSSLKFNIRIIDYEVADFDADGDGDLMLAYRDGIRFHYVENGEIVQTIEVETYPLYDDYDMEMVDIDADGDLDIVEIDSAGAYIYINIGTKYAAAFDFDNVLHWPQDFSWVKTYEFVDADNDGDYDVVISDYYGGLHFWENIGNKQQFNLGPDIIYNGNPLDAALYYERLPEGILNDFAFVDLDNDGDKDFFALDTYGGVFYFENQGTLRGIDYEPTSFHKNITFTVTDTDGYDTLDVRTDISSQQIDMNPGGVSSIYGLIGNVVIDEDTVIERVYTGSDNDFVEGNSAGNRIYLNDGHDSARGNEGNDVIDGGRGHDLLSGGPGNDELRGGDGDDTFVFDADGGKDTIYDFEPSADTIQFTEPGLTYADLRFGGIEGDVLITWGDAGQSIRLDGIAPNTILGEEHFLFNEDAPEDPDDGMLEGTSNADMIEGGDGNDTLRGLGGDDTLSGNAGDDMLDGGPGADMLDGGLGSDTASYQNSPVAVLVRLHNANAVRLGDAEGDTLVDIEHLVGSEHNDILAGDGEDNVLRGGGGNDDLYGGPAGGDDEMYGDNGDDRVFGGRGDDTLTGGEGSDLLKGGPGEDILIIDGDDMDVLYGGTEADTFRFFPSDLGGGTIRDFTDGEDMIDLTAFTGISSMDELDVVSYGDNVRIRLTGADYQTNIILSDFDMNNLDNSDFMF